MKYRMLFLTLFVGVTLWLMPPPQGLDTRAWHLFAIFITTIFGMISKPMPMGAVAFTGLLAVIVTGTLPFEVAFSGFSDKAVWLIVFAFFIARGFIKTGLAMRISYLFMQLLGNRSIGLGYGIVASELLLAPAIPSSTARSGGIMLPIIRSLAAAYDSKPHDKSSQKLGSYLVKVAANSSCITSAMFMTSMAANPLIVNIAEEMGIEISWGLWALAAAAPGVACLLLMPLLLYLIFPPEIKASPEARTMARLRLEEMGAMKRQEWVMLSTLLLLLILWVMAIPFGIKAVVTAMLGLVILIVMGVLTWQDIREESDAWDTLIWFAALVTMAVQLGKLGFTEWLSVLLTSQVVDYSWPIGLAMLTAFYFYAHYFFASNLAHVATLYATFLGVALGIGAPPLLAALIFGFFSSLFGSLTQYSCGPAALLFGAGYVHINNWWKAGFLMSLYYLIVWFAVGAAWWKLLGLL